MVTYNTILLLPKNVAPGVPLLGAPRSSGPRFIEPPEPPVSMPLIVCWTGITQCFVTLDPRFDFIVFCRFTTSQVDSIAFSVGNHRIHLTCVTAGLRSPPPDGAATTWCHHSIIYMVGSYDGNVFWCLFSFVVRHIGPHCYILCRSNACWKLELCVALRIIAVIAICDVEDLWSFA